METKLRPYLFCDKPSESRNAVLYRLWNWSVLFGTSALVCFCTLVLSVGPDYGYIFPLFFHSPLILLLNFLPVFLLQLILYCIFGRQWISYLVSSAVFIGAAVGNWYKMKFRYEPFMFSDMYAVAAGFGVMSEYDMRPGLKIVFCAAAVVLGTAFVFFFARRRFEKKTRLALLLASLISLCPLWMMVYSSDRVYRDYACCNGFYDDFEAVKLYVSKGFVYSFIHSVHSSTAKPEGYSDKKAESLLEAYEDAQIADDKRVNILAYQLEGFSDLSRLGVAETEEAFSVYHELEKESLSGNLGVNIYGGGTVNTERCVLTGMYALPDLNTATPSYAWYLRSQGYLTIGSHPNRRDFYSRYAVNQHLGFENYYYQDYYQDMVSELYNSWNCDSVLFAETLRQLKEAVSEGKSVFSFNITLQTHSPYTAEKYLIDKEYVTDSGLSDETRDIINRYLNSAADTQRCIKNCMDELRGYDEPVVLLLFGDHQPSLGDGSVYSELGLDYSGDVRLRYSTRYMIWANPAAEKLIGHDISGEGPDISACWLMNLLFECLGWEGNAYMQYCGSVYKTLPIISTLGYCVKDGVYMTYPDEETQNTLNELGYVQYYLRKNFKTP